MLASCGEYMEDEKAVKCVRYSLNLKFPYDAGTHTCLEEFIHSEAQRTHPDLKTYKQNSIIVASWHDFIL